MESVAEEENLNTYVPTNIRVSFYGKWYRIKKQFLDSMHDVFRSRDETAMRNLDMSLIYKYQKRTPLPLGLLEGNFDLVFSHLRIKCAKAFSDLKTNDKMRILLSPWKRGESYIFLLYQPDRLPVALVNDIDPDERKVTASKSYEHKIFRGFNKVDYALDDMVNALECPTIRRHEPSEKYIDLDPDYNTLGFK